MPVKIVALASTDPREITLNEYEFGRANFDNHYFVINEGTVANFYGQDFGVPWAGLQSAVDNYCSQYNIDQAIVGVRLVHSFDTANHSLFYRMQLCRLIHSSGDVYDIDTTYQAWYKLSEGVIGPTTDESLSGTDYLNTFSYEGNPGSEVYETLSDAPTTYVRNLVYPWEAEILQMFIDNGSPQDAMIHFAACSYVQAPETSNVTFPHGNVLYLSVNNVPLLNNEDYMSVFQNKGADAATLCPPTCDEYVGQII